MLKYIQSLYQFSHQSPQQLSYFLNRKSQLTNHQYPPFSPTSSLQSFQIKYSSLKQHPPLQESIAGRITAIRKHDNNITKYNQPSKVISNPSAEGILLVLKANHSSPKLDSYHQNPCLWMLPQYASLEDQQTRFRNRHLDLITNQASLQKLKIRAKIISYLRHYLEKEGYMEVETPVLSMECGGAIAKPFKTYHNDHKMDMYMRIAPQLYLKKLLIGGISKVYEIGKNFRNESIDQTHNPQFTSCQLYSAYSNYMEMKTFTENLISEMSKEICGSYIIQKPGTKQTINLTPPWKTVDFISQLEKQLNVQFPKQFNSNQSFQFLIKLCKQKGVNCQEPITSARLLDKLSSKYLQNLGDPLFIMNHPRIMSPLAKTIQSKPHLTQRFQLFINGWEIVNSYTELNDPRIQKQNTPSDVDYIQALEYGLMPCAGWGIGIDRLVMLLTGSIRIQQIIAFPLMRDKSKDIV